MTAALKYNWKEVLQSIKNYGYPGFRNVAFGAGILVQKIGCSFDRGCLLAKGILGAEDWSANAKLNDVFWASKFMETHAGFEKCEKIENLPLPKEEKENVAIAQEILKEAKRSK